MSKNIIIIIMVSFMLYGCQKQISDGKSTVETIRIDPMDAAEYVNLSEIAESVECIALQVDSGDVMGRVYDIIVKKKYIYATDYQQDMLFVFDKSGQFVSKLAKKGQGHGEYQRMATVFINNDEEFVEVFNRVGASSSLLKYRNITFDFIESTPFPDYNANGIKEKDGLYYWTADQYDNEVDGEWTNAELLISDKDNRTSILFNKKIETNRNYFSIATERFSTNPDKDLFFSTLYTNTFYRLDGKEATPIMKVDFGKYGIGESISQKSTQKQMDFLAESSNIAVFPVLTLNDGKMLLFSYFFKRNVHERGFFDEDDARFYLKMKKDGKAYHAKRLRNDLTDFPKEIYLSADFFGCQHDVWFEDCLVDVVVPGFYFRDGMEQKITVDGLGEISADSDPIVVLVKLKG